MSQLQLRYSEILEEIKEKLEFYDVKVEDLEGLASEFYKVLYMMNKCSISKRLDELEYDVIQRLKNNGEAGAVSYLRSVREHLGRFFLLSTASAQPENLDERIDFQAAILLQEGVARLDLYIQRDRLRHPSGTEVLRLRLSRRPIAARPICSQFSLLL